MKSITEFPTFLLNNGIKAKTALAAEGKTPEEIQTSLGETFKFEGDKLKHFVNAIDVAGQNATNLKRVLVVTLAEGEAAPNKAVKVEETHYIPEFLIEARAAAPAAEGKGGRGGGGKGGGRGGRQGGPEKSSPWGLSPEQKAAKNNKGGAAAAKKPAN
jgi:hypothetical protein